MSKPDYIYEIPHSTLEGLRNFFEHGYPPGSFVRAVLENDFTEAFSRADSRNLQAMFYIAQWMYNEAPSRSYGMWGSPEAVENHIRECSKKRAEQIG